MSYVSTIRKKIGNDLLILAGSNVIILDETNRFLLQKRPNGVWGLLGGFLEVDETLEETAIREVFEESNLQVNNLQLVHVFSGPKYHFTLENLDEVYSITALYFANEVNEKMMIDNKETLELRYFDITEFPDCLEEEYRDYITYFINNSGVLSQNKK